MIRNSLRFRLALLSVAVLVVVLGVLWVVIGALFIDNVEQQLRTEMDAIAENVAVKVSVENGHLVLTERPRDPRFLSPAGGRYWQVTGPDGEIFRSRSLWDVNLTAESATRRKPFSFFTVTGPDGDTLLFTRREMQIERAGKEYHFLVWAGFKEREFLEPLDRHYYRSRLVMLVAAGLLLILVLVQPMIGLRPLGRLTGEIARIRSGAQSRISESVPTEVAPLVGEINLLLMEREAAVEKARERASDLAHGLKTPLTVLGQLVLRLDPADRENALEQVELIRQRADRQLQAARLGVGAAGHTDVSKLIAKLVAVLKPAAIDRNVEWSVELQPNVTLDADPSDVAEAIGNPLDNAVKWCRSKIAVRARTTIDGAVLITIADDGPGVPEQYRETVLRRGGQLFDGRQGSGLGLAICADVVDAYAGTLRLGDSALGGLLVEIRFPPGASRRLPANPP